MLTVGDIHLYVSHVELALRFWAEGLQLRVADKEFSRYSAYACLEFPDGGPSIRLFGPVDAWPPDTRPPVGARPTVRFDIVTSDFDDTLARLLEHGGRQLGEVEVYEGARSVTIADPDDNTFELIEVPD
jgi:catechol 2,3-dioxygenase-like lactoylglutathione lyase family enzyme